MNIAFYGSHNAAYAVEKEGKIIDIVEVERLLGYKNSGMAQYLCPKNTDLLYLAEYIPKMLMKKYGIREFDTCFFMNTDVILDQKYDLQSLIPANRYEHCLHHHSHAAGSFYQSFFDKAIIFSFDGGGNDGKFNVYTCTAGQSPVLLERVTIGGVDLDLGFPYMIFGHFLDPIKQEDLSIGNLVYSGKLMGLASYGNIREEWMPHFIDFYMSNPSGDIRQAGDVSYVDYQPKIDVLGKSIGVLFDSDSRLDGQTAYDIAATSQAAFENVFLDVAAPFLDQYKDYPVVITGGCGLNIILNTRLVNEFKLEVSIGPNPNDCGLAAGMLLNHTKKHQDLTYLGLEILDLNTIPDYIQNVHSPYFETKACDLSRLVQDIKSGLIVGVLRGRSEHGPRALGNRSILCDPSIKGMKDDLNQKVKNREFYRPFAPVVRLQDVNKFFEWERPSKWMSFCPKVREEYWDVIPEVTHVDRTARVQTVTRPDNPWLYDLLTELDKQTGLGVLLNTSFNIQGKPILTTVKDAFDLFINSRMDCLLIQDTYIKKK